MDPTAQPAAPPTPSSIATPTPTPPSPAPRVVATPTPPTAAPPPIPPPPACDAASARGFHRAIGSTDVWPRATIREQGLAQGERSDITVAYDVGADAMLIADHVTGERYVGAGRLIQVEDADGALLMRQEGASLLQTFLEFTTEEGADTDPFSVPTSWFETGCTFFRGSARPWLHYSQHQIFEQWIFDAADGSVLLAVHQNNLTGTDLTLAASRSATIPAPDLDLERLPATLVGTTVFEDYVGEDYVFRIVLDDGTTAAPYVDLSVELYDHEGDFLETFEMLGGSASGQHGSVQVVDSGGQGIADAGDLWIVSLGPEAYEWAIHDAWAGDIATSEWASPEAPEPVGAPPAPTGGPESDVVTRHYAWTYSGEEWTWDLEIPRSLYEYYLDQDFVYRDDEHAYDVYVSTPHDDEYIALLAEELRSAAAQEGWSEDETLSFALAFVQSLPYTSDEVTTGFDEFPRYPVETLVDNGGDCEDTSILYASIVQALGYAVILVSPPGHMAVGVGAGPTVDGYGYTHEGFRYLYAETTGDGWSIGEVPDEYRDASADLIDVSPTAVVVLGWEIGAEEMTGYQHVILHAENTGSAPVTAAELWAGLAVAEDEHHDADSCQFASIEPGETASCTTWLALPPAGTGFRVDFVVSGRPGIYITDSSDVFEA